MSTELALDICKAKEAALQVLMRAAGVGALRFVMGRDFEHQEITFLKEIYFPYLADQGYRVSSGGTPNECSCPGLCHHVETGFYVVSLKKK